MTETSLPSTGATMDRRIVSTRRFSTRQRRIVIGMAAVAILVALLWRFMPANGSRDVASANIEVGAVTRAPFDDYLPVRATVTPAATTIVGTVAGGQVERLMVQDGAFVAAGQPLATLTNPELKLDVMTREADIASRMGDVSGQDLGLERNRLDRASQLDQATYDLLKARRELGVRQQLRAKGLLADAGVRSYAEEAAYQEKRVARLQAGEAKEAEITRTQEARLADTRARLAGNLDAVRSGLDALTIRAPIAGRLTNFTIQPGQTLKAGDVAGQVDSEGSWKLVADVDEYYLGRVAPGQAATTDDGAKLVVAKVLPTVASGRFQAELAFKSQAPAGLNRGQTMDLRVTLGATSSAIVAPVGGWLDSGGGDSVFVLDADGRHARRRLIRVGRRNPEQVEILSGLAPGDRIVISNTAAVTGDILNID